MVPIKIQKESKLSPDAKNNTAHTEIKLNGIQDKFLPTNSNVNFLDWTNMCKYGSRIMERKNTNPGIPKAIKTFKNIL